MMSSLTDNHHESVMTVMIDHESVMSDDGHHWLVIMITVAMMKGSPRLVYSTLACTTSIMIACNLRQAQ
jgi:hypothetical protein